MLDKILDAYSDQEFLKADGFDKAVIGVDEKSFRLIYSVKKCLRILMTRDKMTRDKMTREQAIEYFEFNVSGAFVGDKTPIWCEDSL
jgi:hypothetical protein